ncbi:Altered inheritance of mitochondria protein 6 [Orbilia brochopaga]|uniref:Altered inheritance of mitochondria protein 6 n=1 Tax=Orbilia brochopaga TaxID=3140254 RepID=A0AAV9U4U0_9PEZI
MLASLPLGLSKYGRDCFATQGYILYLLSIMLLFGFIVQYLLFAPSVIAADPAPAGSGWKPFDHIAEFLGQWGQRTGLGSYPSSFTRGIEPKPLHSHNDYWRDVPLYQGLSVGAISTEADVYAIDGELLVGHEKTALSPLRTFRSLYVNPLMEVLAKQNSNIQYANGSRCGVFDEECFQTLYLWVDLKTDAETTWPLVVEQLAPLREKGYLARWDGETLLPGPITVIGTGNASWKVLVRNATFARDYFVDAPLLDIGTDSEPKQADGKTPLYDRSTSLFATASLQEAVGHIGREMSPKQLKKVEALVKNAKSRGLQTRIWQTPNWPTKTRRNVWRQLMDIPVGLLNVDDLEDAANGDW